jgi:HEAT repeat protein
MNRRSVLRIAVALVLLAGLALLIPQSPVYLPRFFGWGQNLFEGQPYSYWVKALDSPDEAARAHAIHALGALGPDNTETVPVLAKLMLDGPTRADRIEAALALTKLAPASRAALPQLGEALADKEPWVRMNAAIALAGLGADAKPAVPALLRALKDPANQNNLKTFQFTIRDEIVLALGRTTAGTNEAVPALIETLKAIRAEKTEKLVAPPAGQRAGGMRGGRQMKMKNGPPAPEKKGLTSLEVVIWSKICCARALGEIGPPAQPAVPLLRAMLKEDQISDFKFAAEDALQKIEGKPADKTDSKPADEP